MRSQLDRQLAVLKQQVLKMGALCSRAIALTAQAMDDPQAGRIAQVDALEMEIDQMERDVEALCLKLLLRQQPVAGDLRQVSAALKMITDLERIGDQAADIADILPHLRGQAGQVCQQMAQAVMEMVEGGVTAYAEQDIELARAVADLDEQVDRCFDRAKQELIELISQQREKGEYALDLFLIAKYFERMGDHATNIAEWAGFSITGIHRKLAPEGRERDANGPCLS